MTFNAIAYHNVVMEIKLIIERLHEAGLSDGDIAREISTDADVVAPSIVNRWKNGVHKTTSYQRYERLQNLLKQKQKAA